MTSVIEFNGFEPTPEIRSLAKDLLLRTENKAPSRAALKAFLEKTNGQFRGTINVTYNAGQFDAVISGPDPKEVLESLYSKIREDFKTWKESRLDFI